MFGRNRDSATGAVDGGAGRGVRLGGTDDRPPTGYRKSDELEEPEIGTTTDPLADYDDFADPGDTHPDDRRRDPLRR